MKPYFAKYLPVEGEIEVGDYFVDEYKQIYKCTKKDNGGTWGSGYSRSINLKLSKKVKLFLCSRDIQVGDEVTSYISGKKIKANLFPHTHPHFVKVIGEISPDATWVKEGQEFSEEEVKINFEFLAGKYWIVCNSLAKNIENEWIASKIGRYTMKIKGPCGHYH